MAKEFVNRIGTMPAPSVAEVARGMYPGTTTQQLARLDNDTLTVGAFSLTPTGLRVGQGATLDDWERVGKLLQALSGSLQWLIGDWLVMGERVYRQTYDQIADATGYDIKTIYQYAWVASAVDFSIRIEKLSFGHHQLVASLGPDQQRLWLDRALQKGWSIAQLRKQLRGDPPPLPGGAAPTKEQKQAKRFAQYIDSAWDKLPAMDARQRQELVERARWLSQYYAYVAAQAGEINR